jgi:olfactory receptor
MDKKNQTKVTEFYFSDFPQFEDGGLLLFILLLCVYLFIVVGNAMIFLAVQLDVRLHIPCTVSSASSPSWRFATPQ